MDTPKSILNDVPIQMRTVSVSETSFSSVLTLTRVVLWAPCRLSEVSEAQITHLSRNLESERRLEAIWKGFGLRLESFLDPTCSHLELETHLPDLVKTRNSSLQFGRVKFWRFRTTNSLYFGNVKLKRRRFSDANDRSKFLCRSYRLTAKTLPLLF